MSFVFLSCNQVKSYSFSCKTVAPINQSPFLLPSGIAPCLSPDTTLYITLIQVAILIAVVGMDGTDVEEPDTSKGPLIPCITIAMEIAFH